MEFQQVITEMPIELKGAMLPPVTNSYQPVGHANFVKFLAQKLQHAGYEIDRTMFQSAAKGEKMVGTLRVKAGNDDFGMTLGFRNSYDKSMSLGVGVGAEVFVCN
jgi:hypothetical protein